MRLLPLLLLCGCGADFTGTWAGATTNRWSCTDGSGSTIRGSARWVLADKGDKIEIAPDGSCGTFTATSTGLLTAHIAAKSCGRAELNSSQYSINDIGGGELTMDESRAFFGATLNIDGVVYATGTNNKLGTCHSEIAGQLTIVR